MALTAIVTAVALAAGAGAGAPGVAIIHTPDWLEKPTSEQVAHAYPKLAATIGLEGYTAILCSIRATGLLDNCKVELEAPTGFGFGAAALSMTPYFRMSPKKLNGHGIEGGVVKIPIRFRPMNGPPTAQPPENAEPPPFPAPTSSAIALGKRLALSLGYDHRVSVVVKRALDAQTEVTPGADPANDTLIKAALVEAASRQSNKAVETAATTFAQYLSEAEMFDAVVFFESLSAKHFFYADDIVSDRISLVLDQSKDQISSDAITILCKQVDCTVPMGPPLADVKK